MSSKPDKELTQAQKIIYSSISAHGGEQLYSSSFQFIFREKTYSFTQKRYQYVYQVEFVNQDTTYIDQIRQGKFMRTVNGDTVQLSPKEIDSYSNALNSVLYFQLLPFKLADASVISESKGMLDLMKKRYEVVRVTFTADGGKDHEDEFYYWFDSATFKLKFLAYSYHVNGGGVRFRVATNPRVVAGVRFTDYLNYEVQNGSDMQELPKLYAEGKLKLLSKITNEDIRMTESFKL